jgi:hypothetical protein
VHTTVLLKDIFLLDAAGIYVEKIGQKIRSTHFLRLPQGTAIPAEVFLRKGWKRRSFPLLFQRKAQLSDWLATGTVCMYSVNTLEYSSRVLVYSLVTSISLVTSSIRLLFILTLQTTTSRECLQSKKRTCSFPVVSL